MARKKKNQKVSAAPIRRRPGKPKSRITRAGKTKKAEPREQRRKSARAKAGHRAKKRHGLLAKGGGNATAAGVTFQASVGAVFATQIVTESQGDDRLDLATFRPRNIRFESDAPLDDFSVETDQAGWIFTQAKTKLDFSTTPDSEFGKTAKQIVRQWCACRDGDGSKGWNRPLVLDRDRLLIAVGSNTGKTITSDLAKALDSLRAHSTATLPQKQREVLKKLRTALGQAWKTATGTKARAADIDALLPYIGVLQFDMRGADRAAAVAQMRHLTPNATAPAAKGAFIAIERECQSLMEKRHGADAKRFRRALIEAGIALKAAPSYQPDIAALRAYSERIAGDLAAFELTQVDGRSITVTRAATGAVVAAAKTGSLLVIGEPGAGKSAVVSAAASALRAEGCEVIQFAVDRLPFETPEGLRAELGLSHRIPEALENWPGKQPGYVFIDALDATRGGHGEYVFRALIQDILALPGNRWRVVASIRSFDLKLGERFRELFAGRPPDAAFRDNAFSAVRHINIPAWSEAEFDNLLSQAPSLGDAMTQGGQKLRDLAAVPFNTRLLADLLASGLAPTAFGDVATQVELLGIYWGKRVTPLGNAADVCLRAALEAMVASLTLQAERVAIAAIGPSALDALQRANVLVAVIGNRYIAFRHHILFDYAASRLFIDPLDIGAVSARLVAQPGLALMLAPALAYTLHDVWLNSGSGHPEFWSAIVELTGRTPSDPVARSVAARMASELPADAGGVGGLVQLLRSEDAREQAAKAITQVVGALTVGIEDGIIAGFSPWCRLADDAIPYIAQVAWPIRTLLSQIVTMVAEPVQRDQLGRAARALLTFALADARAGMLVPIGIDLVCDTYETDAAASRRLLASLMTGARFEQHSHEDMPAIARKTNRIAQHDPDFAVEIYRTVFANRVTNTAVTSMGNSRILPLTSNRRQDYEHARWQLCQFVPGILERRPELGVRLLIAALEGLSASEHPSDATEISFDVSGRRVKFLPDYSHIWAHDPEDRYAHANNAAGIIKAFKDQLANAKPDDAVRLANMTIVSNRLGILWARMFLAAARRPDVLGELMWPYASRVEFLRAPDTRKDAIDAIAAAYPRVGAEERLSFERAVFTMPFDGLENPDRSRRRLLSVLFGAIGADHLVTDEAKGLQAEDAATEAPRDNRRLYSISSESRAVDHFYWLAEKGVDVEAPPNADLLGLADAVPGRPNPDGTHPASIQDGLQTVRALAGALGSPPDPPASPLVADYAHEALLSACASLARRKDELRQVSGAAGTVTDIVEPYLGTEELRLGSEEKSAQLRASAVEAAMLLAGSTQDIADRLVPCVERHLQSEHDVVREEIAENIGWLWEFSRDALWRFADYFAGSERSYRVLQRFTHFMSRALHHAPQKIEELMVAMIPHARGEDEPHGDRIIEAIGNFAAILWMRHGKARSRALLTEWLGDMAAHLPELSHAAHALRDTVVLGYEGGSPEDTRLRHAAQALAYEFVDAGARAIDDYLNMEAGVRTEADTARVQAAVRLCDNVGDQLYFSSGAFRENQNQPAEGLVSIESRLTFLNEMECTLRRIGDVGTPHTIYYLIDMLRHLRPADPARVFDLVAHALLNAGQKHGYQFEGMGNDRFVEVMGIFIADNREIFKDPARRARLIACLDAFVEAGWPKARRLLYRLPELL